MAGNLRGIFDRPFAGPEMKNKYEAALGKFLVAFNGAENYMRWSAHVMLESLGHQDLWGAQLSGDDFTRQLKNLRLLSLAVPAFPTIPFERLARLNATRNMLAHGHYDQDLFSDDFQIVGKKPPVPMTLVEVNNAINEAEELWAELGQNISDFLAPPDAHD
jgi:hypothetical protein